jgi:2-(1,2-epoxy-1,2-dihydrophenyl)acetyl-CoA isomerase
MLRIGGGGRMHDTILVTETEGVGVITLNRPAVRNALNTPMRAALTAAVTDLGARLRVVVLTGAGQGFCAGQDLADRAPGAAADLEASLDAEYAPMLRAIRDCPVPVVAAVNGAAAGAGASLALACDVVIAAESAVFLQAFLRIGLIPDAGGTWTLPRLVGPARAMGAMLLAEPVTARQAESWGMIWEAVPDHAFAARWQAVAARIAAGPPAAQARLKTALRATWANGFDDQMALEARLQGEVGRTEDFAEGVAAFLARRPARFTGR